MEQPVIWQGGELEEPPFFSAVEMIGVLLDEWIEWNGWNGWKTHF